MAILKSVKNGEDKVLSFSGLGGVVVEDNKGSIFILVSYDKQQAGRTIVLENKEAGLIYSKKATSDGSLLFTVNDFGLWTAKMEDLMEDSVNVTEKGAFNISLSFLNTWTKKAGITKKYDDISEALGNQVNACKLMSSREASDYLLTWINIDSSVVDSLVESEYAMKWIGLRDYICDKLMAIDGVTEKFLSSEYWEYILKDKVPVMTSNTAPYGECIASSISSNTPIYNGFNGIIENSYNGKWSSGTTKPAWLGYKFTNPICVKKFEWYGVASDSPKDYILQASNDGSSWVDIQSYSNSNHNALVKIQHNVNNNDYYLYYRMYVSTTNNPDASRKIVQIANLQFYGRTLIKSIPKMTSDTLPYGRVIYDAQRDGDGYKAWHVFDKDINTFWQHYNQGNTAWIGYIFPNPVIVKYISWFATNGSYKGILQASNDGNNWIDLIDNISMTYRLNMGLSIPNDMAYQYYRVILSNPTTANLLGLGLLDFYYSDYSEPLTSSGFLDWIDLAGLPLEKYNSLNEVLADQVAVRKLMTIHASSDYLVANWDSYRYDILRSEYAMKWIGLRDYICDKLMEEHEEELLGTEYWEYILKDHVPVMTSNTAPYGEASATTEYNNETYKAYNAFNGKGGVWLSTYKCSLPQSIQYKFVNPICVKCIRVQANADAQYRKDLKAEVYASNDGTNFVKLSEFTKTDTNIHYININNDDYYLYYRLTVLDYVTSYANGGVSIRNLQFYGRSLNVSVPTMTSNTSPYGEVIAKGIYGGNYNNIYFAFNKNLTTESRQWESDRTGVVGQWIGYNFQKPINIKCFRYMGNINNGYYNWSMKEIKLQYSDDGNNWFDVDQMFSYTPTYPQNLKYFSLNSDYGSHLYWRIYCVSVVDSTIQDVSVQDVDFYGLDYSEREFAEGSTIKYIYDHGIELEPLTAQTSKATKESNYIKVVKTNSSGADTLYTNDIDITPYKILRATPSDTLSSSQSNGFCGAVSLWSTIPTTSDYSKQIGVKDIALPLMTLNDVAVDVSAINQNMKCVFGSITGANMTITASIKEWWLE